MTSDLSRVADADVMLMFMESYGAVTWQRPDFVRRLAAPRRQLSEDIRATGRRVVVGLRRIADLWRLVVVRAYQPAVRSSRFAIPNANALLMTQRRETMVGAFARRGFRTIALMPGLWQPWPEGSFYGFQDIYGGERLDYKGPQFGWWDLPDQFTLAKFDAVEVARQPRPPLFVFFPTVSTHTPFTPTPPYQPDWARDASPRIRLTMPCGAGVRTAAGLDGSQSELRQCGRLRLSGAGRLPSPARVDTTS